MVTWLPKEYLKNENTYGEYPSPFLLSMILSKNTKIFVGKHFGYYVCVKGVKQAITAETTCFWRKLNTTIP